MEKIVDKFGREFIAPICCNTVDPSEYMLFGGGPRPPYLTPTERPRFICNVYRIWGLLLNSEEQREQRLKSYKLKDLLSLEDIGPDYISRLIDIITSVITADKQPTGIDLRIPIIDPDLYPEIIGKIRDEVDHVAEYAYGCSPEEFHGWAEGGSYMGPLSLVDDCRPMFKNILVNAEYTGAQRLVPVDEVWYDTSDGEAMDYFTSSLFLMVALRVR